MIIRNLLKTAAPFGRYSRLWREIAIYPDFSEMARRILTWLKLNKLRVLDKLNARSPLDHFVWI
jgi:hypothetical protein